VQTLAPKKIKKCYLQTVLAQGLDIAKVNGIEQVLVAGDWNMTELRPPAQDPSGGAPASSRGR